jgi:hypothetical protein
VRLTRNEINICIYESRPDNAVGVKLLVLSIARHEPAAKLHVFVGHMGAELQAWVADQPNASLYELDCDPQLGWNVKPKHLLSLLDKGISEVVWLDSDLIVTRPFRHLVTDANEKKLIVAEEYFSYRNSGVAVRAAGWGLTPGRDLPFTPNTCILRVTQAHRELLEHWQELLDRADYVALQGKVWTERPFYMVGDQDALAASLGSHEFVNVEIRSVRRGYDIAQCFMADGYGPMERVASLWRGIPSFVHAQGQKPWDKAARDEIYQLLSPYRLIARDYAPLLDSDERDWLSPESGVARGLRLMVAGHPALSGLVPSALARVEKRLRSIWRLIGMLRRRK